MKTLGQVGYEAYAESTGGLTWDLRPMPKWEELPPKIQKAWEAAGLAILVGPECARLLGGVKKEESEEPTRTGALL